MKLLLAFAILCPLPAAASSFERFDAPGATTTCGMAIASNGLVAGEAYTGTIVVGQTTQATPSELGAFLYRSGHFTYPKPAVPAGTLTFTGVNRFGAITGLDFDKTSLVTQNFLYAYRMTSFPTVPDASSINLVGITDQGTLLGVASISGGELQYSYLGFLKTTSGALTLIDDGSHTTFPAGMDQTGTYIVGHSLDETTGGWIYHAGTFTPVSFPGAAFTYPTSVTSKLLISGNYNTVSGTIVVSHGFRFKDGAYTTFNIPGATSTVIGGMNEAGQITGCFTKGTHTHGFLYTP